MRNSFIFHICQIHSRREALHNDALYTCVRAAICHRKSSVAFSTQTLCWCSRSFGFWSNLDFCFWPGHPIPNSWLTMTGIVLRAPGGRKPEIKLLSYWQSHMPSETCRRESFLASASFYPHGPSLRIAAVQPLSLPFLPPWLSSPQVWVQRSIFLYDDTRSPVDQAGLEFSA